MSFFRSPEIWKSKGKRSGLWGGCWSVSEPNFWSLSLTGLAVRGRAISCKMVIASDSIPGRFDFMARRSTLSHQEMNHTSLLFWSCLHFSMLDEHTLHYAHLQSNKETTVWICGFSLCMSPTLQMAVSIRNNNVACFCEERVLWRVFGFHLTVPYIYWNQE